MAGLDLSRAEARSLMSVLSEGTGDPIQVGAVLVALQVKGVRPSELAGLAEGLRERALTLAHDHPALVDTCGTGGGRTTFNLSTGAALIAAAAGAKVAKHGNRSVTSHCGSVDVLEELGVTILADPERLRHLLDQVGIVFLFAQHHHGSMKVLGPVRKSLGVRTVFNQLGPLANPAGARMQLVGVYDLGLVRPMAEALALLGAERAFVVHGEDGLDEVSPCAPTAYAEVSEGRVKEGRFEPRDFGFDPIPESVLFPGSTVAESAEVLHAGLTGTSVDRSRAMVPNAAVTVMLAGLASSPSQAASLAWQTIESGAAARLLDKVVEATSG